MLPSAKSVITPIPAVNAEDPALRALMLLKEHGVVVLVDSDRKPFDILTACDLGKVRRQVEQGLGKDSPAAALFSATGREVYAVSEDDDLGVVAQQIARHRLATGIVAVRADGRYAGYIFSSRLRESVDEYASEVSKDVRSVAERYPEAWSSVRSRVTS